MSDYEWDNKIEYLRNTRDLYYNDDYLEFLVKSVWKITQQVNIVDYGCGYGYLGLKLLPLLPEGSTYTGIDRGTELINTAREIFARQPFTTNFIVADVETLAIDRKYDLAVCHALLLHLSDAKKLLDKMINCVKDEGMVICFEPHWIANMSNYSLQGYNQSQVIRLGILQKLFEQDTKSNGKDGNIGIKIPEFLSELGLTNVQCRVSDKVNFLDPNAEPQKRQQLYNSLREEGIGGFPGEESKFIRNLMNRGLTESESQNQYEAEYLFSKIFSEDSVLTYAPNMKISFGTVKR
ncbi:methyltransferase domain-containing protein [Paenibacillus chondroitinus]|uniref:Methyltransferase domain-containing protein n=1 Tax=Paenibacillus chondroitinus TaxID=59842 RepID=A0ABU6DD95_9BACL|nr:MULTISPECIES: methyltransferase domain-containing protein [Paenibacillus]MCY9662196.1 class I SAM-dependent methyltransferase [Paenibacillus anseongense]MEB4795709.1 methyltransferase domain-containing protein [Paenibacillus chondroitinus]